MFPSPVDLETFFSGGLVGAILGLIASDAAKLVDDCRLLALLGTMTVGIGRSMLQTPRRRALRLLWNWRRLPDLPCVVSRDGQANDRGGRRLVCLGSPPSSRRPRITRPVGADRVAPRRTICRGRGARRLRRRGRRIAAHAASERAASRVSRQCDRRGLLGRRPRAS